MYRRNFSSDMIKLCSCQSRKDSRFSVEGNSISALCFLRTHTYIACSHNLGHLSAHFTLCSRFRCVQTFELVVQELVPDASCHSTVEFCASVDSELVSMAESLDICPDGKVHRHRTPLRLQRSAGRRQPLFYLSPSFTEVLLFALLNARAARSLS